MEIPILLGILLVATAGSTFACAIYAIQENLKTPINKVFLALSIAMVIWCLGLAITVAASDAQICAFGRRLAPVGWGTICSLLLHFVLLLTWKNNPLKHRWIYPLLYLPAAVTIYAYTYLPLISSNQDQLIRNQLGWINIAKTDVWDWFYYGYIFVFIAISIVLIALWARKSDSERTKRQGKLLTITLVGASLLGTMTDILPIFLEIEIPQISPVFALFAVFAVSYLVKHHGFMRTEGQERNGLILNESAYSNIYKYIALICVIWAGLNLGIQFFIHGSIFILQTAMPSAVLIVMAGFIFLLSRSKTDNSAKEMMLASGFSFVIPFFTIGMVPNKNVAIWAFVFLLLIVSMLFNRRILLMTVVLSSILTQILVWAAVPPMIVEVGIMDYIMCIVIIVMAAIVSLAVNGIYVQRLQDNAKQVDIQMMLAEISHGFVSVSERNFNEKIKKTLKRCGEFIDSDRAGIALFDTDKNRSYYSAEWRREEVAPPTELLRELEEEIRAALLMQHKSEGILRLNDTKLMATTKELKNRLDAQKIGALLALPIKSKDSVIGVMVFTRSHPVLDRNSETYTYLQIIANIIADAITKVEAESEIKFIAYHDQLTMLPNRILLKNELERKIRRAKRNRTDFAVAFLDIDSFKSVNDEMGHDFGDQLLFETARILSLNIRPDDIIGRYGGDEFVILLSDIERREDVINILERIFEAFREPVMLDDRMYTISVSIGVSFYPQDATDSTALISKADDAMYAAKADGKGRYSLYTKDIRSEA